MKERLGVEESLLKKFNKDGILLFVKYPESNKVKSRLSNDVDQRIVKKLYRLFVQDILQKLNNISYEKIICFYPVKALEEFKNWLGQGFLYIPQKGNNLGAKLKNCFIKLIY